MRRLISLSTLVLSTTLFAHEVRVTNQHLKLNRQQQSAWQSDIRAKATLSEKWEAGLTATYLERFDRFEKSAGVFALLSPSDLLTIEAQYIQGPQDVEILPRHHYQFTAYHGLKMGMSPFLSYANRLFSVTHVQSLRAGIEIERIQNIILIPQIMIGQARFDNAAEIERIHNFGLKAIYYRENLYSFSVYGYKGAEASQGIFGQSNILIKTLTAGTGLGYHFTSAVKTEFLFDYTDYDEINNQFLTSTLNLVWKF